MANFHPKSHQDSLGQLHQSLEQLGPGLTDNTPRSGQGRTGCAWPDAYVTSGSTPASLDWEAALESAAADIDHYFEESARS
jgi:hypothetical protein